MSGLISALEFARISYWHQGSVGVTLVEERDKCQLPNDEYPNPHKLEELAELLFPLQVGTPTTQVFRNGQG